MEIRLATINDMNEVKTIDTNIPYLCPIINKKSMRNAIQRLALLPIVALFLLPAACYQIQLRVSLEKCPLPAHPLRLYKPIQLCRLQKE